MNRRNLLRHSLGGGGTFCHGYLPFIHTSPLFYCTVHHFGGRISSISSSILPKFFPYICVQEDVIIVNRTANQHNGGDLQRIT